MPIRVLHIVGIMNMGGLENLLMNIYRKIDRSQIQFDFLVTREETGIFDKEIRGLGGTIYNVPHLAKVGPLNYQKNIYNFFKQHQEYSIVHCHRDAMCALYLKQAKRADIPTRIAHSHTIALAESKDMKGKVTVFIKEYFKMLTHRYATDYFACSKEAGEWLFGKRVSGKQLKVIKNGIETGKYIYDKKIAEDIRKSLNIDDETLVMGHVGRFDLLKNHSFIIDLFTKVEKQIPKIMLCLIGNGTLENDIKQTVKELGLENKIKFLGIKTNVNKYLMAFDVFVFPSLFEGLGIVAVEAQATGLKCIVSDQVPKEADMDVGLIEFLTIHNSEIWSDKVKLINSQREGARIERVSNQKMLIEKGYDILSTVKYLEEFYLNN